MSAIIQALSAQLRSPVGATDLILPLRNLKDSTGQFITVFPSGATEMFCTVNLGEAQEIVRFVNIQDDGNGQVSLVLNSVADRNLSPVEPFTTLGATKSHATSTQVIISNNPQVYQDLAKVDEDMVITGDWHVPSPATNDSIPNKAYVDAISVSGASRANEDTIGISKLTLDPSRSLGTATITIASPAVITTGTHNLIAGDTVLFTTTGNLPTNLLPNVEYYVIATGLTATTFQLSTSLGGSAIDTSGTQSGTHTAYDVTPVAVGDNDGRVPTQDENDALVGNGGTPSTSNTFVTEQGFASLLRGVVLAWTTNTAPTGWLICDGTAVDRTTYSALFAIIGTTYGSGDGSTTFNLPNLKGRVIVARDDSQTEFDNLNETGGAKTHTLTTGEIPSHAHGEGIKTTASPSGPQAGFSAGNTQSISGYGVDTGLTGGGGAHNNLQPYLVLNYIIKY